MNKFFSCIIFALVLHISSNTFAQKSEKQTLILISTSFGDIKIKLYNETPKHRDNFIKLVKNGTLNETLFHRVIKNFMIQGGDPTSKNAEKGVALGEGGLGYTIPAEFNSSLIHKKGVLAAAREPDYVNPEKASSSCQFYIVQGRSFTRAEIEKMLKGKNAQRAEKIEYTTEDLGYIVNTYYPDIRKILNFSQQSILDGKIKISKHDAAESDTKLKVIELLKNGSHSSDTFNKIRQLIADADVRFFDEYYKLLYEKVEEYANGKDVVAILTIAEYMYQSSLVVDKEITFMACIARLLKEIR